MKKTISFLFAGMLLAGTSFAQKGSILLAGNLSFQYGSTPANALNNQDAQHSWTFGISPQIGYQFSDAWTVGIVGGYSHLEQHQESPSWTNSINTWSLGPFLRYTRPLTSWVSVYGQFEGYYQDAGPTETTFGATAHESILSATIFPALFFNVKNGFGINVNFGGLQYGHNHIAGIGNAGTSFGLTFGNTAVIGVSKNFGGHKKS